MKTNPGRRTAAMASAQNSPVAGVPELGEFLPVPRKDVSEQQHRHVASHSIAAFRHGAELGNQRGAGRDVSMVDLGRVDPGWEIRVLAMCEPARSETRLLSKRLRRPDVALHKPFRMFWQPGMIEADVVRHEIEHQFHAVLGELGAKRGQSLLPAQCRGNAIFSDGIGRAPDVSLTPARQEVVQPRRGVGMSQIDGPAPRPAGPNSHQPDMSESQGFPRRQDLIWYSIFRSILDPRCAERSFSQQAVFTS